jgi:hypothetical protein
MKTRLIILIALIAIAFSSCSLNGSSNYTPEILFVTSPFVSKSDTLSSYLTDDGIYHMDTINVGDTVTFRLYLYGYTNNLVSFNIVQSDTSSTKILLPTTTSLDSIFSSTSSNYSTGNFIFKSKITNLYLPFKYVAKKINNDAKLSFYLSSDATFDNSGSIGNNSVSVVLATPIKLPIVIQKVK